MLCARVLAENRNILCQLSCPTPYFKQAFSDWCVKRVLLGEMTAHFPCWLCWNGVILAHVAERTAGGSDIWNLHYKIFWGYLSVLYVSAHFHQDMPMDLQQLWEQALEPEVWMRQLNTSRLLNPSRRKWSQLRNWCVSCMFWNIGLHSCCKPFGLAEIFQVFVKHTMHPHNEGKP